MSRLISPMELVELKKQHKNLIILDCRFDLMDKTYGIESYKKSHIEGAFLVDIENDLTDEISEHGGRHPFKNIDEFVNILKKFGITNDTYVVTYDDGDLQGAGRLVYQLNHLGHKNAFVLDGGMFAYKKLSLPIESTINTPTKTDVDYKINIDKEMFVDMDYVRSKLYDENTIIVDSRSNPRYLGLEEPVDKIAGHIPSAKNYFFQDVLDLNELVEGDATTSFKSDEFINKHFEGLKNKREIIVYCGSGISLMVNALALDKCGIDYKIYRGSYSDWISYDDNEIKTGEE